MNQRSGRPAQDEFKLLCSQGNITCNPSSEDDHGWDFIIEIMAPESDNLPADKVSAPRQVLVQVKSTNSKFAKTRIKLSNALKFAQTALPCFIVLFQYKKGKRQHIYARHFWKTLMERSLERGRIASVEGKPINQSVVNVSFTDEDDHSSDLIQWMIDTVNAFPIEYGKEKRELAENLGYESQNYRGEVSIGPLKGIEEIVDHQLGLTESLPVQRIKLVDSRFGIDAPTPLHEGTSGQITLRPNDSKEWTLVLQASDYEPISLQATVKSPAIPGLPLDKFKILIETWLFKATMMHSGAMDWTLQVEELFNRKLPIARLNELARLLSWESDSISMKAVEDGLPLFTCRGNINSDIDKGLFLRFANITKELLDIQSRAGVPTVQFSLFDLQNSLKILSVLHDILTPRGIKLNLKLVSEWKYENSISQILGYIDVEVGGCTFLVIFDAPVNMQHASGNFIELICGQRMLRDCFVGKDAGSVLSAGQTSYEEQCDLYGPECLGVGNFRDYIK